MSDPLSPPDRSGAPSSRPDLPLQPRRIRISRSKLNYRCGWRFDVEPARRDGATEFRHAGMGPLVTSLWLTVPILMLVATDLTLVLSMAQMGLPVSPRGWTVGSPIGLGTAAIVWSCLRARAHRTLLLTSDEVILIDRRTWSRRVSCATLDEVRVVMSPIQVTMPLA